MPARLLQRHCRPYRRVCAPPARDSCHAPWRASNWLLPPPVGLSPSSSSRHREDDCPGRPGILGWRSRVRNGPAGRFPGSSAQALSNPWRIAFPALRLRQDSDLHMAPGAWSLITAAGRNVFLAWLRGARMGRFRCPAALNAGDVLTLLACIYPGHRPAAGGSRYAGVLGVLRWRVGEAALDAGYSFKVAG